MLLPIITGSQINVTLKENAFLRLISRKSPQLNESNITENMQDFEVAAIDLIKKHPNKRLYNEKQIFNFNKTKNTLKELKNFFTSIKDKDLNNKQQGQAVNEGLIQFLKNSSHLPFVMKYLIHWASTRSISKSVWSEILRPGTLQNYIQTIGLPMLLIFKDEDLVTMSKSELEERYSLIIDDGKDTRNQATRAKILRDFHIHLENYYSVSPIYIFQEYINKGIRNASAVINVNILMPWEYSCALRFLSESSSLRSGLTENQAKALQVLLILGFRCGLRRDEARFIRLQDIEIPQSKNSVAIPNSSTLFITPHDQRSLKSNAAERKIPIGYLLTEPERKLFADFLKLRVQIGTDTSDFLFYLGAELAQEKPDRATLTDEQLYDPLNLLLQRITGDSNFRHHHLRHSFATWTFWALACPKNARLPVKSLCNTPEFNHLDNLKKELFNFYQEQPTRKYLHFVSEIIGHVSPSITLTHYIHSASWLSWCEFDYSLPTLTRDAESNLATIEGRSASRARQASDIGYAHTGMSTYATQKLIRRSCQSNLRQWKKIDNFIPPALDLKIDTTFIEVDLYRALIAHFNHNHPAMKCAQDANVTIGLFENACRNVEFFFDQKFSPIEMEEYSPRNHIVMLYEKDEQIKTPPLKLLHNLPPRKLSFSIACKMLKVFNILEAAQKREVLWACHYIVTRCSSNWHQFKFSCPKEFTRFMTAFQAFDEALHIKKRVRFGIFNSVKKDEIFERYLSNQSVQGYSLNLRNFKFSWTPGVEIEVDFIARKGNEQLRKYKKEWRKTHPRANRKQPNTDTPQNRRRMSEYGFRFGMYLIFFAHYRLSDEEFLQESELQEIKKSNFAMM